MIKSASTRRRSAAKPAAPAASDGATAKEPPRPYWVPAGVSLDGWPAELRAAVAGVVNPAYDELVLRARPGLQQSTGLTVVHLLWLEILDQLELGRQWAAEGPAPATSADQRATEREARALAIARHLRLCNAKLKASELLNRLQDPKMTWTALPAATSPGDVLAAGRSAL